MSDEHQGSTGGVGKPIRGRVPLRLRRIFRFFGRTTAAVSNVFFPTPLGAWLHERLRARLEVVVADVPLAGPTAIEWPTIAYVSDVHAGHYMTAADLEQLAGLLMALSPDLVCLGGDLINHHEEELALLDPALRKLRAPLGVFAVPGNHDYVAPGRIEGWRAHLEARGVHVLWNHGVRLEHRGATLWLAGVDDLTEGEPRLEEALSGRRPGEATLLLSHHPDLFLEASERGVDLQLSDHTHGGQVRLLGCTPVHHSRFGYVGGLYRRKRACLYVGRGAGVTLLPIRIGTRGEVTLLRPRAALDPEAVQEARLSRAT